MRSTGTATSVTDVDPTRPAWRRDATTVLAGLRDDDGETGGVHFLPHLGYWVVTRHADVTRVLGEPDTFSAANAQTPIHRLEEDLPPLPHPPLPVLSNADAPHHTRIRRAVAQHFTTATITTLTDDITRHATHLADNLNGDADLVVDYAAPLPAYVILGWIGFPASWHDTIIDWCRHKLAMNWGKPTVDEQHDAARGVAAFWQACRDLVAVRRTDRHDDLTSALLTQRATTASGLSDEEISSIVFALAFAGHETTAGLIAHTTRALLHRPTLWDAVLDSPHLLDDITQEVLRLDSSVITWRRRTTRPVTLGGTDLPAGADVLLGLASANTDPAVFDQPTELRPGRRNATAHRSFGYGTHYCLGHHLARTETRIAVHTLRARHPHLRLHPDADQEHIANLSFRRPTRMPITTHT